MKRVLLFTLVYCLCGSVASAACGEDKEVANQNAVDCAVVQDNFNRVAAAVAAEEYCGYKLNGFEKSEFFVGVSEENNKNMNELLQMIKKHGKDVKFFPEKQVEKPAESWFCLWNEQVLLALGLEVTKEIEGQ